MSPEQLQEGTRQIGVNFYSTPNILRRLWVNRRHPLIYLGTSFAWRHTCRIENSVSFFTRSGPWKQRLGRLPAMLALPELPEEIKLLHVPTDENAVQQPTSSA
jgi:hypothetical protein